MTVPDFHRRTVFFAAALVFAGLLAGLPASADGPPATSPEPTEPPAESRFHETPSTRPEPPVDPFAKFKIDTNSLIYTRVQDDKPLATSGTNPDEYRAYNQTVVKANQFTATELEAAARKDVTFADLVRPVRKDYQFDLIQLEGRLFRLRKFEPEKPLLDAGIDVVYEGWMFPYETADPVCVLTTELPPGLELTEPPTDYKPPVPVKVAGYYFKLFWYESSESDPDDPTKKRYRKAPMLMAKSFTPIPPPPPGDGGFWLSEFLPGMLLFLVAVTAVLMTLNWYFRRGDRRLASERIDRYQRDNPFGDGEPAEIPD